MATNAPAVVVGNVTRDPELAELSSGTAKCTFSVASERRYMKGGEWTGDTSFFNVIAWRDQAVQVAKVLSKGTPVIVTGYWQQRSWENDEGEKRSVVEVVADNVAVHVRGIESWERVDRSAGSGASSRQGEPPEPEDAPW